VPLAFSLERGMGGIYRTYLIKRVGAMFYESVLHKKLPAVYLAGSISFERYSY
jgi:hypothetical protein